MIYVEHNLNFRNIYLQLISYHFKASCFIVSEIISMNCTETRNFHIIEIIVWSFPIYNQQYIGENSNFQGNERSMMGNKPWKKTHSRSSFQYYTNRIFSFERINMLILGFISILSLLALLTAKWNPNIFAYNRQRYCVFWVINIYDISINYHC